MADLAVDKSHLIFVAAAVFKNGKILIGQRDPGESHEAGKWGIPGGKVDRTDGEVQDILEQTVIRETKEETGVNVDTKSIKYLHSMTFIRSTGHHVVALLFTCNWKSGTPITGEDTVAVRWIGLNDLDTLDWAKGTKEAVKRAFDWKSRN